MAGFVRDNVFSLTDAIITNLMNESLILHAIRNEQKAVSVSNTRENIVSVSLVLIDSDTENIRLWLKN